LVLTDDFRNAKYVSSAFGDTFIAPIGENLIFHSINLVKNVFTEPMIPNENVYPEASVDYILTPNIIDLISISGSQAVTSLFVEWRLVKQSSGKALWVETIKGQASGNYLSAGWSMAGDRYSKRIKAALQDLFENTQNAMLSSSILKKINYPENKTGQIYILH
jgi:hypothetical protein